MNNSTGISWRSKYTVEQLQQALENARSVHGSIDRSEVAETIAAVQDKPVDVIQGFLEAKGAFGAAREEHGWD